MRRKPLFMGLLPVARSKNAPQNAPRLSWLGGSIGQILWLDGVMHATRAKCRAETTESAEPNEYGPSGPVPVTEGCADLRKTRRVAAHFRALRLWEQASGYCEGH